MFKRLINLLSTKKTKQYNFKIFGLREDLTIWNAGDSTMTSGFGKCINVNAFRDGWAEYASEEPHQEVEGENWA